MHSTTQLLTANELADLLRQSASLVCDSTTTGARRLRARVPDFGVCGLTLLLHGGVVQNSPLYVSYLKQEVLAQLHGTGFSAVTIRALPFAPALGCLSFALTEKLSYSKSEAWSVVVAANASLGNRTVPRFSDRIETLLAEGGQARGSAN